jgi:hypothetical protein
MSIRPLTSEMEIAEAYATFAQSITENSETLSRVVGYQGGSEPATLYWHESLGFWALLEPERIPNRYWCGFGVEDPRPVSMVSITCEINPPREGFNRQCAGLFVRDSHGHTYLAHSGKIGGGRPGIGKTNFLKSRDNSDIAPVIFPDKIEHDYIVIGRIDDSAFLTDLARFVSGVAEFKEKKG